MKVDKLFEILDADFYSGVPDSQLKALCDFLIDKYGIDPKHHLIAANEGNCVALAAGYNLATGKVPVVYMQNSGEGNIINPVASLINEKVYGIPMIFIIGWRGEPGVHDEPQHIYQGEVTIKLLEDMDIKAFVIDKNTTVDELKDEFKRYKDILSRGKSVAFVIRKGALSFDKKVIYKNNHVLRREEIIEHIVKYTGKDPIVCTTGKASRELYEIREKNKMPHCYDFLTVGSMGHASSIALGFAINKSKERVWCIDGDGAWLMHLGATALIGNIKPQNMVHIVINNGAHETVGGMPTVSESLDMCKIASGCGYEYVVKVKTKEQLEIELSKITKFKGLCFLEVESAIGAREDLGRPTTTPIENKEMFIKNYGGIKL
jgi:phosphonopyruvate decarboxylase